MAYINGDKILFSAKITGKPAIIHCDTALPTTDISTTAFYEFEDKIHWYDGEWHTLGEDDIEVQEVVADENSVNGTNYVQGTPGIVALYNRSGGLRYEELRDNSGKTYGKRLQIAAADLSKNTSGDWNSMNNPIVPGNFRKALERYTQTDPNYDGSDGFQSSNLPPSLTAMRDYVAANSTLFNLKVKILEKGQSFTLKPSTIALVNPYSAVFAGVSSETNANVTLSISDMALIFATDTMSSAGVMHPAGDRYRCSLIYVDSVLPKSFHQGFYTKNPCTITNNNDGKAYVYYVSRYSQDDE